MKKVPIDHRACVDIDGDATERYLEVGDFLVGVCWAMGNKWSAARQRARNAELILEMVDPLAQSIPEMR